LAHLFQLVFPWQLYSFHLGQHNRSEYLKLSSEWW
jgi:hypothetical protein